MSDCDLLIAGARLPGGETGGVDPHVHFNEPGSRSGSEGFATGSPRWPLAA